MQRFLGSFHLLLILQLQLRFALDLRNSAGSKLLREYTLEPPWPRASQKQRGMITCTAFKSRQHYTDSSPAVTVESTEGMMFEAVFARSRCHPMEQLVEVEQEFLGEMGDIYIPACVPLQRCSGCCADENEECHPTRKRNITLQVMRIRPGTRGHYEELTFVEHESCHCRVRGRHQNSKSNGESIRRRPRSKKHKAQPTVASARPGHNN